MEIIIRQEQSADYSLVENLTREAFWNLYRPGCDEHFLVNKMRSHEDFIQDLDFVAIVDGTIVGNIMYTKSSLIDEQDNVLETVSFGPLCVHPDYQRKGIGSQLIEHTKQIVISKGYPAIIVYGDPHNYCKHGFRNGLDYGVSNLEGKYPLGLLVLELKQGILNKSKWKVKQSDVYNINEEEVEAFDKNFEFKEKKWQYSQEIFSILIRACL